MTEQKSAFPPLPEIGRPESYYSRLVNEADLAGDAHSHEAAKVGQYITLALRPELPWEEKQKYFRHVIKRHCHCPYPDAETESFYARLCAMVKEHAGAEALRLASTQDDIYAARLALGQTRESIENDAEEFFSKMCAGDQCPDWFNEEDWSQLKLIRDQWI